MANGPQLVWQNPHPAPHFKLTGRMLTHLADAVAERLRGGQEQGAKALMSLYALSPIALGVVAGRLSRAGIPEDVVLRIV